MSITSLRDMHRRAVARYAAQKKKYQVGVRFNTASTFGLNSRASDLQVALTPRLNTKRVRVYDQ